MGRAHTLLIADDNEIHNYAIARWLQHCGYRVLRATSGAEALQLVSQHMPDAVLLDISLPDVDGFELCRRIRENPENSKMAVILYSGIMASGVPDHHLYGADAFLTYPVEDNLLRLIIEGTITRRRNMARGATGR